MVVNVITKTSMETVAKASADSAINTDMLYFVTVDFPYAGEALHAYQFRLITFKKIAAYLDPREKITENSTAFMVYISTEDCPNGIEVKEMTI